MKSLSLLAGIVGVLAHLGTGLAGNSTYFNPILPKWHSDPSCAHVNGTFYCVTSTFIAYPGLPIYASKDLVNWKLLSHAWNRDSQLPGVSWATQGQQRGIYAATIRYGEGTFFVIGEYLGTPTGTHGVVFKSTDPFVDSAWSDPVIFRPNFIDPDLFWDDDGKSYTATQSVILQELNLDTGALGAATSLWNGTGGLWPEGPHLYRKDGYYYLLIAEGGTATDHSVTMARSKSLDGPYVAYEQNPVLTARRTDEYFQTDASGNWWGVALATRSGPEWQIYPMGRETVLFPVTWKEGQFPVASTVRGKMSGWPLPKPTRDIPGDGPFNGDPDAYDFDSAAAAIPKHFVYWRVPRLGTFTPTTQGLQVVPSRNNLTGQMAPKELTGQAGLSFVGRRQTDTLFTFSVDVTLAPGPTDTEAGVTVFLTQYNHIDLDLVRADGALSLRFRAEAQALTVPTPAPVTLALPASWAASAAGAVRLEIRAANGTHYNLCAARVSSAGEVVECSNRTVATAPAQLVSGGTGTFVGSLVGVYATCNGAGAGTSCPSGGEAYFRRWRYTGEAQAISATEEVPSTSVGLA